MTIQLRPLQTDFIQQTHTAMRQVRRVCAVAPCGFGKRYVLCWWAMKAAETGRKMLVVTNRRILVEQMAQECQTHGIPYGIIMGDEPKREDSLIQVASIQTLQRRNWRDMPEANLVAIDECHHLGATYAGMFDRYPNAKCVGVTATPVGPGGKTLVPSVFDAVIEPIKK